MITTVIKKNGAGSRDRLSWADAACGKYALIAQPRASFSEDVVPDAFQTIAL